MKSRRFLIAAILLIAAFVAGWLLSPLPAVNVNETVTVNPPRTLTPALSRVQERGPNPSSLPVPVSVSVPEQTTPTPNPPASAPSPEVVGFCPEPGEQQTAAVAKARFSALQRVRSQIESDFLTMQRDGVVMRYPPESPNAEAILDQVLQSLEEAATATGTRRRASLQVVVYRDRSELLAVTCTPSWVGGVYDGTLRLIGEPSTQVIRHEGLHAQTDPSLRRAPLWVHEGVAQWFAAHGQLQWNRSMTLMANNGTYIPFRSLSDSFMAMPGAREAELAYAQSVAMVCWLVDILGERAVPDLVAYYVAGGAREGVLGALGSALDEASFMTFLQQHKP